MSSIRCLEPQLARGRQHQANHSPVENLLTPVPADPVEHHISRESPQETDGKRKPPPNDTLVAQHGRRDDRHFLRDWHPQAAEHEHDEDAEVSKVVEELLECLYGILTRCRCSWTGTRGRRNLRGRCAGQVLTYYRAHSSAL